MSDQVVEAGHELLTSPYVRQMVVQLRALDSYGTYDTWSDDKVLDPLILTKERRREIPVVGDPDETVVARVKAYYNALAVSIEAQTGLMAVPFINLTHEGFGRALVIIGKLVVIDRTLRDIHRFGFDSIEKLVADMDKMVGKAVALTREHENVATL